MGAKEIPAIAARLKGLREESGISQQDLAVKAGLSVSLISQIEQGKKADLRISTIKALADALGKKMTDLIDEGHSAAPVAPGRRGRPRRKPPDSRSPGK